MPDFLTWLAIPVGLVLGPLVTQQRVAAQSAPTDIVNFLKANPARSSIVWSRNDTVLASRQPVQVIPLASTVKLIIAIEFAQQVAAGRIRADEHVSLIDLDHYYLPFTDGNAHPNWKQDAGGRNQLAGDSVTLLEIAKGMIQFSSNANTEYLMERLGLDRINANLPALGLTRHTPLYPIVAAVYLAGGTDKMEKAALLSRLKAMSAADYQAECQAIHERLKADRDGSFRKAFRFPELDAQRIWSDRLPASTTADYNRLLQLVNSRTHFPSAVHATLDPILEWLMTVNPKNKTVYQHVGAKGGSTAFVLTYAFYATTLAGDRTEVAVFFNDLTQPEFQQLGAALSPFLLSCVGRETYRGVAEELK